MTRTRTLLLATAIALTVPLAAIAQTTGSGMKCGPVAFSADKMAYTSGPCVGGEVGTAGPTAAGSNSSSSMIKAEQKAAPGGYVMAPMQRQAPMQAQAVSAGPDYAPMMNDQCGPANVASITDEYGRKYNCRGDRIR